MIGKAFIYQKKEYRFVSYEIKETVIKITTETDPIVILTEDAADVQNLLLIVEEKPAIMATQNPSGSSVQVGYHNGSQMATSIIGQHAGSLAEIIMGNISKIQTDPTFIPQAEATNNQIKTLIDVAKTEVEMLKVAAYMSR